MKFIVNDQNIIKLISYKIRASKDFLLEGQI